MLSFHFHARFLSRLVPKPSDPLLYTQPYGADLLRKVADNALNHDSIFTPQLNHDSKFIHDFFENHDSHSPSEKVNHIVNRMRADVFKFDKSRKISEESEVHKKSSVNHDSDFVEGKQVQSISFVGYSVSLLHELVSFAAEEKTIKDLFVGNQRGIMEQQLMLEGDFFLQIVGAGENTVLSKELKDNFLKYVKERKPEELSTKKNPLLVLNEEKVRKNGEDNNAAKAISRAEQYRLKLTKVLLTAEELEAFSPQERDVRMKLEQEQLEITSVQKAVDKYEAITNELLKSNKSSNLKPEQRLLAEWYRPLLRAIQKEKLEISAGKRGVDRRIYGPCLQKLSDEKLAVITMHAVLNGILMHVDLRVPLSTISLYIGEGVQAEIRAGELSNDFSASGSKSGFSKGSPLPANTVISEWDRPTLVKLGAFLVHLLVSSAKVTNRGKLEAAFYHGYSFKQWPKRVGVICVHEQVPLILKDGHALAAILSPKWLPMVYPPRDWVAFDEGAYLQHRNTVMRMHGHRSQADALKRADLTQVFKALNCLGRLPWKINIPILNLIKRLWNEGHGFGEIPTLKDGELDSNATKKQRGRILQENRNLHSLRMSLLYRLEVAQMLGNRDFYMPYNLDFRGRAYPIPPHLNHLGSDVARSLLIFGRGKMLGAAGLYWLKIHLANFFGKDKLSLDDRALWTDQHLSSIQDSAKDPYAFRWWASCDKPFEALATCIEINNALKLDNPEKYVCSLPVHMDGSCNGLQHYAALGRDQWGGAKVNLTPSALPQDVYMAVCDEVNRKIDSDADSGNEYAILVRGHVSRKVVKQTVMTSVYGVTLIGARDQIAARLKELHGIQWPIQNDDNGVKAMNAAAGYIAKLVFQSLGTVFKGAWGIMEWLAEVATLMARAGQSVSWITPLGLPVVQPYRFEKTYAVQTVMQKMILADHSDLLPVSLNKQRSAFPPNFVHSLDSSHMLLTAIECSKLDIDFASVHDSYWTHPSDIEKMNLSLRKQFVEMHSGPILENLHSSIQLRFPTIQFPCVPPRGTLDLNQVFQSKYFFD